MRALFGIVLVAASSTVWSEVLFVGVGADGEPSFTDAARDGYVPVHVEVPHVGAGEAAATRSATADIQAIADELAEARRARESARAFVAPPAPRPVVVYEETYRYPLLWPYRPFPPAKPRPPSVAPPPAPPPRQPFEPAFRPYNPVNGTPR